MSGDLLLGRGDPVTPGAPSELLVLGVIVGGFWLLVAAILLALWWARRRAARPEVEAHAEKEEREHVAYLRDLKTGEQSSPSLRLPPELSESARLLRGEHRLEG